MKIQEILKSELLPVITGLYENPHFIVDIRGNVFFANQAARDLLRLTPSENNIFDVFSGQTSELFYSLLKGIYKEKEQPVITQVSLRTGESKTVRLRYSFITSGDEKYLSCTLAAEQLKFGTGTDLKISSQTDITPNSELLDLLARNYPFTFTGKDLVRRKVDQLKEFFWVKDLQGKFLLVNRALSEYLGLEPEKIEGTEEEMYIPDYLKKVSASITEFVLSTGKSIKISGVLFGASPYSKERFEVPLLNKENKVYALAGMTVPVLKKNSEETEDLFSLMPLPAAVINSSGVIKKYSNKFRHLFNLDKKSSYNVKNIFPQEVSSFVESFIFSNSQDEVKDFFENDYFKVSYPSGISVYLKKLEENQIIIFISELKAVTNMQENISQKGKVYDILIQSNPEPVFIYERENLRFMEVNQAALNLYGFTKSEFLQMDLTDLYAPEDIQSLLSALHDKIKEGEFSGPFRQKKKDGSFIYVEIGKFALKYGGKDTHYNLIRDVSGRLEIEKEAQLFKSAFDNTEQLAFVTDASGFIRFINNAVIDTLGYLRKDLAMTSFAALVKDEERGNVNSAIFKSSQKESAKLSVELKNAKGELVRTKLTATPVLDFNNEVDAYTIVGELFKPESVKEITKEIVVERIMPAGELQNSENNALISSIFHELLTPINVILGFVQELTDNVDTVSPEQKEAVEIINQNRVSLLNTMNSIVEYYNIERRPDELNLLQVTAADILDNLRSDFKELNKSRGIDILPGRISSSLFFETDKGKFTNLLFLLAKIAGYLSKERKVYISLYQTSIDKYSVTFKNRQEGSTPDFLENIIKVFSPEGMGNTELGIPKLSLRLATRLLNLFKGELYVKDDNSEAGYSFPILQKKSGIKTPILTREDELTRTMTEVKAPPKPAPVRSFSRDTFLNLSEIKCLYIEDQPDSQILFKVQMKEFGEIHFAGSFEEAMPLLDKKHFNLIVMDINLQGDYNGLDALRIIQKMPEYANVPVIAVTAYLLSGDREKFIKAGFNEFVPKPIFREKMIDAMEKVFYKK